MAEPDGHHHGVEHEPALGGRAVEPDAASELDFEPSRASEVPTEIAAETSVRDEPGLRSMATGPAAAPGFAERSLAARAATVPAARVATVLGLAVLAGPLGAGGALFDGWTGASSGAGLIALVVLGPMAEEMLKISLLLWLVEVRPWLVPGPASLVLAAAIAGLGFAAVENVLYLELYLPDAGPGLAAWRWSVCVALHTVCSMIAGFGLARVWQRSRRDGVAPEVARAFPFLVTAMVVHGLYNAAVTAWSMVASPDAFT